MGREGGELYPPSASESPLSPLPPLTPSQLGMGYNILKSDVLTDPNITTAVLDKIILEAHGFAEVMPEHKFLIVEHIRNMGHVTGMTGDVSCSFSCFSSLHARLLVIPYLMSPIPPFPHPSGCERRPRSQAR